MKLSEKRIDFSAKISLLILFLQKRGIYAAFDQVKRCDDCPVGLKNSCHKSGLAADLIFYLKTNKGMEYTTSDDLHSMAHDYWDELGGAERIQNDLGHYSFEHNGVR